MTKACKEGSNQPAASRCVEVEVVRETKALPPLPARLDASSEDEEHMKRLTPDGETVSTIDGTEEHVSKGTKRWALEELRLILEMMKEQENKREELPEHSQKNGKGEGNHRNALIGSSRMTTPTIVQEILNVNITNKYGSDYSCSAMNYGPVHRRSRHSIQNETYMGTSDGKRIIRVPALDGMC